MLVALFSDLHAHKWREFSKLTSEGVNDRLVDCVSVLTAIDRYCQKHGIEHILCLGDLFHKRAILDVETFNLVFKTVARSKSKWWLMDGNHDQATKDGRIHSLEPFAELKNVKVNVGSGPEKVGDIFVDFFPYQDNEKEVMAELESMKRLANRGSIACMHHGFKGARVGSSLEYEVKEPLDPKLVVKMGYDFIFSGHYHHEQYLAPNLMYLGAPLEHTRHDKSNGERGFKVYDTKEKTVKRVRLKRPRFITYKNEGKWKRIIIDEEVKGNFVDLVTDDEDPSSYVKALLNAGARGVEVKPIQDVSEQKMVKRLDVDPTTDPKEVVKKYAKWAVKNGKTKLNADELVETALELIKESQL